MTIIVHIQENPSVDFTRNSEIIHVHYDKVQKFARSLKYQLATIKIWKFRNFTFKGHKKKSKTEESGINSQVEESLQLFKVEEAIFTLAIMRILWFPIILWMKFLNVRIYLSLFTLDVILTKTL